jgi:hypothetical protein
VSPRVLINRYMPGIILAASIIVTACAVIVSLIQIGLWLTVIF